MQQLSRKKKALFSLAEKEAEAVWNEHWLVLPWWVSMLAQLYHATSICLAVQECQV